MLTKKRPSRITFGCPYQCQVNPTCRALGNCIQVSHWCRTHEWGLAAPPGKVDETHPRYVQAILPLLARMAKWTTHRSSQVTCYSMANFLLQCPTYSNNYTAPRTHSSNTFKNNFNTLKFPLFQISNCHFLQVKYDVVRCSYYSFLL